MATKELYAGVLGMALGLVLASCCAAQYGTPETMDMGYSIAIGAAIATGEDVSETTTPIVSIGWYGAAGDEFGSNSAIGLTADWTLIDNGDKDVHLVPVLINYKQYGIIGGYRVFVNFGVGVLAASDDIPDRKIDDGANFGWRGGMGVDLSNTLYGQARYIGGQNPSDDGMIAVQVGYRF